MHDYQTLIEVSFGGVKSYHRHMLSSVKLCASTKSFQGFVVGCSRLLSQYITECAVFGRYLLYLLSVSTSIYHNYFLPFKNNLDRWPREFGIKRCRQKLKIRYQYEFDYPLLRLYQVGQNPYFREAVAGSLGCPCGNPRFRSYLPRHQS